jgi:solute carrier family 35 protein F1/2
MASTQQADDDDDTYLTPVRIDRANTGIAEPSHVGTIAVGIEGVNSMISEPQSGIKGVNSGLSDFHSIISDGHSGFSTPISHVGTIAGIEGVDGALTGGHSRAGTISVVGSVAFTITSTIVEGLVHTVAHWKVLLLGQAISLVLAAAGASNEILDLECGVSTPSTYNAFAYGVVTLFGLVAFKRESKRRSDEEIDEEQLRFHVEGADDEDGDNDSAGSEDDLTVEHESPTKRRFFTVTGNYTTDAKSHGSKSKARTKYPFLCGAFTIHAKWYHYFILALIETQAYYFIFLAFRYTSFTFVYISDALAIPSAMIFSRTIMKKRYSWTHLLGALVCIVGIAVNTVSDMENKDLVGYETSADHIKGDVYAIIGAVLLGLDDVLSEIVVTDFGGFNEMIFMKGFYGTLISIVQILISELENVNALFGANGACGMSKRMTLFSIHVATRSLDFAGEMQFLYLSEAALLNLSLLTSDLYAALFDIISVGLELTRYYYIAFVLIFAGIVLYEASLSPSTRGTDAPVDIEIRQVRKRGSMETTEHAGNVMDIEAELT